MIRNLIVVVCVYVAALAVCASADTDDVVDELVGRLSRETIKTVEMLVGPLQEAGATTAEFSKRNPYEFSSLQTTVRALKQIEAKEGPQDIMRIYNACTDVYDAFYFAVGAELFPIYSEWLFTYLTCVSMRYKDLIIRQFIEAYRKENGLPVVVPEDLEGIVAILGLSDEQIKQKRWHVEEQRLRDVLSQLIRSKTSGETSNEQELAELKREWVDKITDACKKLNNMDEILWLVQEKGITPNFDRPNYTRVLLAADICKQFGQIKGDLSLEVPSHEKPESSASGARKNWITWLRRNLGNSR